MIQAYEREPYEKTLDTEVTSVGEERDRPFAIVADTILFPEGGGQPGDRGTLGEVPVIDVQRVDGEIRHYLGDRLAEHLGDHIGGGPVTLRLDWQRRYDHMQQHTAQHVLSAIAADRHGWPTTSFHLGEQIADIELAVSELSRKELEQLEQAAAAEVRKARAVRSRRVELAEFQRLEPRSRGLPKDHVGDVRLVEIEGLDLNTCGGTHVANTAEIESIKLLGTEAMRGGTRLHWVAGERVRRRLEDHEARSSQLRALLETSDEELLSLTELKLHQLKASLHQTRALSSRLAQLEGEALANQEHPVVHGGFEDADAPFLQGVARSYLDSHSRSRLALLTAGQDPAGFFVLAATDSTLDVARLGARVAELLNGRGGGSGALFQGRASSVSGAKRALGYLNGQLESG